MGITGLIPFLEKSSSKVYLKDIRNCTVAVDTYCWLHKGVFSCAEKLVRGEDTDQYLQYCLKYVHMLLSYDIKPILVFDGRHLPAKELTERRRRDSRRESKKRAAELLRLGRCEEARSHMRRCVDVTHDMALRLIRECRLRNVDCIVAPYEADAQMAWLNKIKLAQYIITEDSDLLLFGAQKIIFKLDLAGAGLLVEADKLFLSMGCHPNKYTFDKFRRMCILSGCDYLDSLPGIGLAKACKFMLKTEEDNMQRALKKLPQYLNLRQLEVSDEYIDGFLKAEATFKHMYIYNPLKRTMERLYSLDEFRTEEKYCCNAGIPLDDDEQALNLAVGNLNPFTLKQLDYWHPDDVNNSVQSTRANKNIKRAKHPSIWKRDADKEVLVSETNKKVVVNGTRSCALFFKKVDFISKSIDEEVTENLLEERSKPEEADLFFMYRTKSLESTELPLPKKQRFNSIDNDSMTSPPTSPLLKPRYNPFAKVPLSSEKNGQFKSQVCENGSLLKVLSPEKLKIGLQRHVTKINNLKRSIFDHDANSVHSNMEQQIEVKSRLFASNRRQLSQSCTTQDFCKDIERIDYNNKLNQDFLIDLSECSSPKKTDINSGKNEMPSSPNELLNPKTDDLTCNNEEYSITLLSDEEGNDDAVSIASSVKPSLTFKLNEAKPQIAKQRTVGLPKPKINNTKKITKNSLENIPNSNQTRLSMFGFQKRPVLK